MRVLGFMTGTSLDAVDMAVLETDGETIFAFGPAGERKLSDATRDIMLAATKEALAWPRGAPEPAIFAQAATAGAEEHFAAAEEFLAANDLKWADLDLIGMHGQTVLHERPQDGRVGRTVQLGDASLLARKAGVPVAYDFRTADVAAGGEGAPLAPIYHLARARASGLSAPLAVLNIGGVANVTFWSGSEEIAAFDTGPGNGMIDLMVQARGAGRFDDKGKYASVGRVNEGVLAGLLGHSYFKAPPPKSLDRFDFSLEPLESLELEDAAATLVAFMAEAVRLGFEMMGQSPTEVIVCGGGRHNPEIMKALSARLPMPVKTAEDHGWRGDSIEAEAFAYLAARTAKGLPISFPKTTGVPAPMTGGRIVRG
ncbi:MAG TPA: anhydro-N-acetylmuramic acid kinase [Phenylobacterium sp.]|jgi:anhydro-N-acetylmuramic acid kinase|uniref:anhydro-N-acetylmuramic acid kinase n=1 Tax=Phenylobacterium sp. TaxID=1871053 RepID=UPI002D4D4A82|nr:anhydro-N-acetylmuramic acid kinase [Phenylobacterium sp.]HZZ68967.1 anhydro-N-acetylmuramic acid kinase [Phenylobacterium sp.]